MKGDIERGLSLSQAISKHPKVFPPVYLSMVRSGETGGMLDEVLLRLSVTLEKQLELQRKIKSAMAYPIAVGCIIVLIVSAMLMFIVPMFEGMYNDLGGTLPLPTRILIARVRRAHHVLVDDRARRSSRRRSASDDGRRRRTAGSPSTGSSCKMPVFGLLVHKTAIARFTPHARLADPLGRADHGGARHRGRDRRQRRRRPSRDRRAKDQVRVGESMSGVARHTTPCSPTWSCR